MSRSRRRLAKGIKPRPNYRVKTPAAPPSATERIARLSPAQVLERISRARLQREELEAELALLTDHAVNLGIGWPQIAVCLRVTRQAARQHYQRRHRSDVGRTSHVVADEPTGSAKPDAVSV
jgi:hypothetical protein